MKDLKSALLFLLVCTVLLGGIYPLLTTAMAALLFPRQAAGSLLTAADGRVVGSALLGQPFDEPGYFHCRPSATGGHPYNLQASGGSNLGPTNPVFLKLVAARVAAFRASYPGPAMPSDMALASASGLDPHISPTAAGAQAVTVAKARGLKEEEVRKLVEARTEDRQWGILGEPRVNVLRLNLDLDRLRL
jgi:K+-transporting ATPase ATPase C chain